jgi:hypothetical protein
MTTPTVYTKVLRQVLLNKIETALGKPVSHPETSPVIRDLVTLYVFLFAQIKLADNTDAPEWFSDDTYLPQYVYTAFLSWCDLPESVYDEFNQFYGQVNVAPNPPHLQPDVTPENPT